MATSTDTSAFSLPNPNHQVTVKLDSTNYLRWLTQFNPILRSNDLMGIVDGSEPCPQPTLTDDQGKEIPNPEFRLWNRKDQCILSWINVTLSEKVLSTVYGLNTSRQVWTALASRFASQSRSHISHLKKQLQNLHQGAKSCSEYLQNAKIWSDELAAVGKPIADEDLISFIVNGLNPSFNSFISAYTFATRENQLSFEDFQAELLSHEMLLEQQQTHATDPSMFALYSHKGPNRNFQPKNKTPHNGSSVKYQSRPFTQKPHHGFYGPPPNAKSQQHFQGYPPKFQSSQQYQPGLKFSSGRQQPFSNSPSRVPCQICGRTNHLALDCYHRMDYSFQGKFPPTHLAAMVAHTNTAYDDQPWLADSGANAHVTNELENLQIQQPFQNADTVAVGNGSDLAIKNIGSSLLHSSNSTFHLKNILHCPQSSANLLSIQKFCVDNSCYFILTSSHFFIKDLRTQATLLEGRSENGLYPLWLGKNFLKGTSKAFTALIGVRVSSLVWHFRLGHPSLDIVNRIVKNKSLPVSSFDFNQNVVCTSCQLGKSKKQPFHASNRISSQPLQLIHTDVWTSPVQSVSGCKFHVIFVDDFSRFTWIYPLYHKSEVFEKFVKFKLLVENQFSTKIKQMQSDGGGEYNSLHFQSFLTKHGIIHRKTCPYTSPQNGVAERKLRHILEMGLTLLAHSHLSNKYWPDAFNTAVYIINRLPTPILEHVSPYFKVYNRDPDYQAFRVFGCLCYPLLRPYGLHKLEYRSKPCIFLGYNYAGYKCLDPVTKQIYLSRHVIFDESSFPAKEKDTSRLPSKINAQGDSSPLLPIFNKSHDSDCLPHETTSDSLSHDPTLSSGPTLLQHPAPHISPADRLHTQVPISNTHIPISTLSHDPSLSSGPPVLSHPAASHISPADQSHTLVPISAISVNSASPTPQPFLPQPFLPLEPTPVPCSEPQISTPSLSPQLAPTAESHPDTTPSTHDLIPSSHVYHPMVTRSKTGSLKPKSFSEYQLFHTTKYPFLSLHTTLSEMEPSSYSKAVLDPRWRHAMQLEFDALISNDTWTLCPRPLQHNVIRNKWVFKIKKQADGTVERFKARLVAKGFDQQSGVDYTETFSPVIKPSTIRIILAVAVQFEWDIRQLDVSNAFLHGNLLEEVYMEQPQGFAAKGQPDLVCKLHKAIYGLKQAPRAWFTRLSNFLLDLGFTASLVDTSLFIYICGSIQIYMLVYVDDIIITGTHSSVISSLIVKLQCEFPVKDLGPLNFFLGIQVTRTSHGLH
jgi:hypothetical protein